MITYIIGGLLLAMAIVLVVLIMFQQSTRNGLSSAISGGNGDSAYNKNRGKTKEVVLKKVTAVVAIVFCVLVLALYVFSDNNADDESTSSATSSETSVVSTASSEASEEESEEESAEESAEESEEISAETSSESEAE